MSEQLLYQGNHHNSETINISNNHYFLFYKGNHTGQSMYQQRQPIFHNQYFATIIILRQPISQATIILDSIKVTIMFRQYCTKATDISQQLSFQDNHI